MKASLFLVLLFSIAAVSANEDLYLRYKHDMSLLADLDMSILVREKRQASNSIDPATGVTVFRNDESLNADTARACAKQCEETLGNSITNETHIDSIDSPFSILKDGFDIDSLNVVCRKFKESESCFTKCDQPSSSLGVYQLICGDRQKEFIGHLPCYQTKNPEPKEVFEKQCGGPGVVFNALFTGASNPADAATQDIGRVLESMRPMCRFLKCAVDYTANALDKRCKDDPSAGSFFREIGIAGARTALGALEAFDAAQRTRLLPIECNAIINREGTPQGSLASRLNKNNLSGIVSGQRPIQKPEAPVVHGDSLQSGQGQDQAKLALPQPNDLHTLASAFQSPLTTQGNEGSSVAEVESEVFTESVIPDNNATTNAEKGIFAVTTEEAASVGGSEQPADAEKVAETTVELKQVKTESENGTITKETETDTKETLITESKSIPAVSGSSNELEELQKTVLRKQLEVLSKTEEQLDLEMKKLQLEIDLLVKKSE